MKYLIDDSEIEKYELFLLSLHPQLPKAIFHRESDRYWPKPDRVGRQELKIQVGDKRLSFTVCSISALITTITKLILFRHQKYAL